MAQQPHPVICPYCYATTVEMWPQTPLRYSGECDRCHTRVTVERPAPTAVNGTAKRAG